MQNACIVGVEWVQSECRVSVEWVQRVHSGCKVGAERVHSGCRVAVHSGCTVDAEWVQSECRVGAERVQGGRHANTTVRGDSRTLRASSNLNEIPRACAEKLLRICTVMKI